MVFFDRPSNWCLAINRTLFVCLFVFFLAESARVFACLHLILALKKLIELTRLCETFKSPLLSWKIVSFAHLLAARSLPQFMTWLSTWRSPLLLLRLFRNQIPLDLHCRPLPGYCRDTRVSFPTHNQILPRLRVIKVMFLLKTRSVISQVKYHS